MRRAPLRAPDAGAGEGTPLHAPDAGAGASAVVAGPVVGADAEQVGKSQDAAHETDAAGGVVSPDDRHLGDPVALLAGEEERLHVEGEAVEPPRGEDVAG